MFLFQIYWVPPGCVVESIANGYRGNSGDIGIIARYSGEKVVIAIIARHSSGETVDIDIIARRHYFRDVGDKELRQLVSDARNTEM